MIHILLSCHSAHTAAAAPPSTPLTFSPSSLSHQSPSLKMPSSAIKPKTYGRRSGTTRSRTLKIFQDATAYTPLKDDNNGSGSAISKPAALGFKCSKPTEPPSPSKFATLPTKAPRALKPKSTNHLLKRPLTTSPPNAPPATAKKHKTAGTTKLIPTKPAAASPPRTTRSAPHITSNSDEDIVSFSPRPQHNNPSSSPPEPASRARVTSPLKVPHNKTLLLSHIQLKHKNSSYGQLLADNEEDEEDVSALLESGEDELSGNLPEGRYGVEYRGEERRVLKVGRGGEKSVGDGGEEDIGGDESTMGEPLAMFTPARTQVQVEVPAKKWKAEKANEAKGKTVKGKAAKEVNKKVDGSGRMKMGKVVEKLGRK